MSPTYLGHFNGKGQATKTREVRTCARQACGNAFPVIKAKRYCSRLCASLDWAVGATHKGRVCLQCGKLYAGRSGHAKTCSPECGHARKKVMERKRTDRCAWCGQWCTGRFCSGDCQHRHEVSITAGKMPSKPKDPADQGPPYCHCGQMLRFGSDPMTGKSLQWCLKCGESLVPVRRKDAA